MEKEVRKELIKNLRNYEEFLDSAARIQDFPDNKFQNLFNKKTEGMSLLNKNLLLKEMLSDYLKGSYENHVVNCWIIKQWGKINFKDEDYYKESITKMGELLNKYEEGGLTNEDKEITIERISSLSKVASFVNPERYFIYDSRAIFSLNWLLKKSGESERFYCQPKQKGGATRKNGSKRIACYDLLNIIRDELKEKGIDVNIPNKVTIQDYLNYCSLIRDIYLDVFTEDKVTNTMQPYKLEMLLFWIAPTKILDEVDAQYKGTIYDKSLNSNSTKEGQQSDEDATNQEPISKIDISSFWVNLKAKDVNLYKRKAPATDYYYINNDLWMKIFDDRNYKKDIAYQSFSISRKILNDNLLKKLEEEFSVEMLNGTVKADYNDKTKIVYYNCSSSCFNDGMINEEELIRWFNAHAKNLVKIINDNK